MSATQIITKSPSQGDASKFASKTIGEKVHIQTSGSVFAQPAEVKKDSSANARMLEKVSKQPGAIEQPHHAEGGQEGRTEEELEHRHSEMQGTVTSLSEDANQGKRKLPYMIENNNKKFYRKRRKTSEQTRTVSKFLLGGNINDPLNLNSLADEEVSRAANAETPVASPLPERNKDPDPVIVPQDLRDPLKLNSDIDESPSLTKVMVVRKRKRRNSLRASEEDSIEENKEIRKPSEGSLSKEMLTIDVRSHQPKFCAVDKIVSPVIPEACRKRKNKRKSDPSVQVSKALLIPNTDEKKQTPTKPSAKDKKYNHGKSPNKSKSPEERPLPKFREKEQQYRFGNYVGYYGYRNTDQEDVRLTYFRRHWFEGKTCLDIGCNTGHVTLYIAKKFQPQKIVGMDIDSKLIGLARKSMRQQLEEALKERGGAKGVKFPVSMAKCFGALPVLAGFSDASPTSSETKNLFPNNVLFRCGNFVLSRDDLLHTQQEEYDTVLCLSITKWIHLNWGDDGLKRFFQRIFLALRPGGLLILEPQAWPSYTKKKKMTETTYRNYHQIKFKPNDFKGFLLQDVGFSSCEVIGTPLNQSKGFRRQLLLFKKLTRRPASAMLGSAPRPVSSRCHPTTSRHSDGGHGDHSTASRHSDGSHGRHPTNPSNGAERDGKAEEDTVTKSRQEGSKVKKDGGSEGHTDAGHDSHHRRSSSCAEKDRKAGEDPPKEKSGQEGSKVNKDEMSKGHTDETPRHGDGSHGSHPPGPSCSAEKNRKSGEDINSRQEGSKVNEEESSKGHPVEMREDDKEDHKKK